MGAKKRLENLWHVLLCNAAAVVFYADAIACDCDANLGGGGFSLLENLARIGEDAKENLREMVFVGM